MMENQNYIFEYYQKIKDGRIIVGQWILLLYTYLIQGLETKLFYFDSKKARKAIRFIENFVHHNKGELAPQLVKLELWQKAMISVIFGIVGVDGTRYFREVFILIGRKCGKSLLAAGIAEYMAYADGEYGADVYFLAPKLDQTDIVYNAFWQSVQQEPDLMAGTKKRKPDIYIAETNTSIKRIAFSAQKSDGFNPHCTVADEVAAWKGDPGIKQYEVMRSALGSRRQPLTIGITTANYINDGIFDEIFKRATAMLLGRSKEKKLLAFLYMIDDLEKWNDLTELQKSLPNLGVSVKVDFILEEIAAAESSLTKKAEFMCKYCNIKQNSSQAWLKAQDIEACFGEPLRIEDFNRCYAVSGLDLSRTTDLTAAVVVIEKDERLNVFAHFWLPAEKLEEATARDGLPYAQYVKRGWLSLSGDNFVDYHDCENWLVDLLQTKKIYPLKNGFDRYCAQYLVQDLKQKGFHMDDVFQGTNLTPVIYELEGLIKDKRIYFGENELLKIHLLGSALKKDTELNKVRLVKLSQTEHVDGTAALLDAICMRQKWWTEIGKRLQNKGR